MGRAQIVHEKNGVFCFLVIMFTPGVMAHFLNFLLMATKNQSQFGQNIEVLKHLT